MQQRARQIRGGGPVSRTWDDGADFEVNKIVEGRILRVEDGNVMVDIGFKSEGSVPVDEWDEGEEPPQVGQLVKVLIEDLEDDRPSPKTAAWSA